MELIETSVLWEPATVDRAAVITIGAFIAIIGFWILSAVVSLCWQGGRRVAAMVRGGPYVPSNSIWARRLRRNLIGLGAAVIAMLGLYVGYATFRASNMLGALHYISDQGNNIANMETGIPQVLCVYRWGEASAGSSRAQAREGCGQEIFLNPTSGRLAASFDDVQLYIEETILFASESNVYTDRYGADFYRGLEYWTADFSEDWTGAISYYIVSREIDDAESDGRQSVDARSLDCLEEFTGIRVEDICGRYRTFVNEMSGAVDDRLQTIQCDIPADGGASLENDASYECAQSYWGEFFRGGRDG